mgnify:FL=1
MEVATSILALLNGNLGLITLVVGCFVIILYIRQRNDHKRELARLVLEEIRYAEKHIKIARERNNIFLLTNKLLPTNSWYSNIHLFVNDFKETDRDSISDFYSKVVFLDRAIDKIAEFKISNITSTMPLPATAIISPTGTAAPISPQIAIPQFQLSAEIILKEIADRVEFLYNTPAADKLRELSERKWYQL